MFPNKMALNTGALSGVIATFPMSAVMLLCKRLQAQPGAIPPEQVTDQLVENSEIPKEALQTKALMEPLVWSGHFAYGLAGGAFYSGFRALFPKNTPNGYIGSSYGFLVWLGSYWGWLPAAKVLPSPPETSTRDNVTRVVSHLVWGYALAKCYQVLQPSQDADDL